MTEKFNYVVIGLQEVFFKSQGAQNLTFEVFDKWYLAGDLPGALKYLKN